MVAVEARTGAPAEDARDDAVEVVAVVAALSSWRACLEGLSTDAVDGGRRVCPARRVSSRLASSESVSVSSSSWWFSADLLASRNSCMVRWTSSRVRLPRRGERRVLPAGE